MTTRDNQCPGECGHRRRVGRPLCVRCWRRLSPTRRSELYRTWHGIEDHLADNRRWTDYMRALRLAVHELRTVTR